MPRKKKSRLLARRKFKGIKKVKLRFPWKLAILPLIAFLASLALFLSFEELNWSNEDARFSLVVVSDSGDDVSLVVMDSERSTSTVVSIPSNTEVSVSRNLGQFAISRVWALGESEDIGGELVAETVVKAFSFPVDAWVGAGATSYLDKGFWSSFGVFGSHSSNLSFRDRVKIFNHLRKTSTTENTYLSLEDTGYLVAGEIAGGDEGYKVRQRIPPSLVAVISDDDVVEEALRIGIVYEGVYLDSIERVSNLVNALGNRVISVRRGEVEVLDCGVYGDPSVTLKKISRALGCEVLGGKQGELDVELRLGEDFSERF